MSGEHTYQAVDDGNESGDIEMQNRRSSRIEISSAEKKELEIMHGFEVHFMANLFQYIFGHPTRRSDAGKRLLTISSIYLILLVGWFYYETCWNCEFTTSIIDDEFISEYSPEGLSFKKEIDSFPYRTFYEDDNQYVCGAGVNHQENSSGHYHVCALSARGPLVQSPDGAEHPKYPDMTGGYESYFDYIHSGEYLMPFTGIPLRASCNIDYGIVQKQINFLMREKNLTYDEVCTNEQIKPCYYYRVYDSTASISILVCTSFETAFERALIFTGVVGSLVYNLVHTPHWRKALLDLRRPARHF